MFTISGLCASPSWHQRSCKICGWESLRTSVSSWKQLSFWSACQELCSSTRFRCCRRLTYQAAMYGVVTPMLEPLEEARTSSRIAWQLFRNLRRAQLVLVRSSSTFQFVKAARDSQIRFLFQCFFLFFLPLIHFHHYTADHLVWIWEFQLEFQAPRLILPFLLFSWDWSWNHREHVVTSICYILSSLIGLRPVSYSVLMFFYTLLHVLLESMCKLNKAEQQLHVILWKPWKCQPSTKMRNWKFYSKRPSCRRRLSRVKRR